MKLLQERQDATKDRKVIKSQVEKRRRERINCSLERLRTMLLHEPQQLNGPQHRVEKAEILEHTVLFLQKEDRDRPEGCGGGRKESFQDGFSTCLQRAAQFLGPQGKGLWLGAPLDTCFAARFTRPHHDIPRRTETSSSSGSPAQTKSILQMLRQKSQHRLQTRSSATDRSARPYHHPAQQASPRVPQPPQRQSQLEIRVPSGANKQSLTPSSPLWRPWP